MKSILFKTAKTILLFCLIIFNTPSIAAQNTYYSTCVGTSVIISGAPNQTINLFSQFTGGIAIGTGLTVTSPILTNNSTFYIQDASNPSLPRIPIFVAVNPVPSATASANQSTFCLGGSATLTANPTSSIENKLTFTGVYDISNAAIKNANTNGGINTSFFPDSLVLISSGDNGSGNPGFSEYAFQAKASGSIRFNWHFTCQDGGIYDFPSIAINNGTFNYFTAYALSTAAKNQRGVHTQTVNVGDTVRIRIETVDNFGPEGRCVISGFTAPIPATTSVDWYSAPTAGTLLSSGNTFMIMPSSSGIKNYFAQSVSTNTCTSATRVAVGLNVFPLPVFSVSGPASLCAGQNLTLNAIGNSSFVWSNNVVNGVPFTPFLGTTTYKVKATTANGCVDSAFKTVVLNPAPTIAIVASPLNGQICSGATATLTGTGANTYAWSGGITNGTAFIPVSSSSYVLTATDTNGCSNSLSQLITVNSLPIITINTVPASALVCFGSPATLTASGSPSNYSWSGGITNGQAFNPSSTAAYLVTATDANGCINTQSKTVSVTSLPVLSVTAVPASAIICSGAGVSLFGNGASTYIWSGGAVNGTIFNPTSTNTYTLTGIGANGCSNTISQLVTVNSLPSVSISVLPASAALCNGDTVTLTASGANTFVWSGGISNGIAFTVNSTSNYSVTATDANGCSSSALQTLNVLPSPNITINANPVNGIVCAGSGMTLTASGANTYNWSGGILNGQSFNPINSATYILMASGTNGCNATDSFTVSIQNDLDYTTNLVGSTINAIQNGANYQWLNCTSNTIIPGQISQSFSPTQTGSYAVIVSQGVCSDTSACTSFSNTGLSDIQNQNVSISIVPNPSNGEFEIRSNRSGDYVLLNAFGQIVHMITFDNNQRIIQCKGLSNGIYFLKNNRTGHLLSQKIVIGN